MPEPEQLHTDPIITVVQPIRIVQPVQHIETVRPVVVQVPEPCKTVPSENARPEHTQTIPNSSERVPEPAQTIPTPVQNAPILAMPEIEEVGDTGRKRKYDETGIYGDISIKDVVLYRYIKKRHFPDLSKDMQEWYEWFYFTEPVEGEKPFRGRTYEQHKRAYERGQRWFAAYDVSTANGGNEAVGHSGATIVPFPKRASG